MSQVPVALDTICTVVAAALGATPGVAASAPLAPTDRVPPAITAADASSAAVRLRTLAIIVSLLQVYGSYRHITGDHFVIVGRRSPEFILVLAAPEKVESG